MCVCILFVLKIILLTSKLCRFNTCSHVIDPASSGIGSNNSQRRYRDGPIWPQRALAVGTCVKHVTPTLIIAGEQEMMEATRVLIYAGVETKKISASSIGMYCKRASLKIGDRGRCLHAERGLEWARKWKGVQPSWLQLPDLIIRLIIAQALASLASSDESRNFGPGKSLKHPAAYLACQCRQDNLVWATTTMDHRLHHFEEVFEGHRHHRHY